MKKVSFTYDEHADPEIAQLLSNVVFRRRSYVIRDMLVKGIKCGEEAQKPPTYTSSREMPVETREEPSSPPVQERPRTRFGFAPSDTDE